MQGIICITAGVGKKTGKCKEWKMQGMGDARKYGSQLPPFISRHILLNFI